MNSIDRSISFGENSFHNVQKEQLFEPLFKNYLIAQGFIVATPVPDLGDDLWFLKRGEGLVRRVQIKSAHSCKCQCGESSRRYSVRLQASTLNVRESHGYLYVLAMADDRFHGLAEGHPYELSGRAVLEIDKSRVLSVAPIHEHLGTRHKEGKRALESYRAVTRGFHFGCLPRDLIRLRIDGSKDSLTLWIVVEELEPSSYRYRIGKEDVTRFFGQINQGVSEDSVQRN